MAVSAKPGKTDQCSWFIELAKQKSALVTRCVCVMQRATRLSLSTYQHCF